MTQKRHRMQVPPNSDLTLGMVCVDKSVPGRCTWRMTADERFANPAGTMQGGFLAAFADSSMGAAAVTFVQGRKVFSANAEMKISFLAPVQPGAILTCTAEVVSGGSTVAFVEASIFAGTRASPGGAGGAGEAGGGGTDPGGAGRGEGESGGGADPGGAGRLVARANSTYIFRSRD
jgi:uncharacterized protein (TIGR00369 family)